MVAPSILLVDDNEHYRNAYQDMLRQSGFHVATACDGIDAIHLFNMVHPDIDLLILDVEMPHVNGAECLREMRRLQPEICCLAITAHIDHASLDEMISIGISGILRKPFTIKELIKWVNKLLAPQLAQHNSLSLQRKETDYPFPE